MRVITKRSLIATVADRYRAAYQRRGEWMATPDGHDSSALYQQLAALPAEASEAAITALVGDNRWTANICDECLQDQSVAVLLSEEEHHPTDAVLICLECLSAANEAAQKAVV